MNTVAWLRQARFALVLLPVLGLATSVSIGCAEKTREDLGSAEAHETDGTEPGDKVTDENGVYGDTSPIYGRDDSCKEGDELSYGPCWVAPTPPPHWMEQIPCTPGLNQCPKGSSCSLKTWHCAED